MIDVTGHPATIAGLQMSAKRRRSAGDDGTPDLGPAAGQGPGGEIGRTEGGEHLGQAASIHAPRSVRREQFEW